MSQVSRPKSLAIFDKARDGDNLKISDLTLSVDEQSLLATRFDGWSMNFIRELTSFGIAGLVDDYSRIVRSCRDEKSYYGKYKIEGSAENWRYGPGISYEYNNYISCRTALQIIIESVNATLGATIEEQIEELDATLKALVDKNGRTFYKKKNEKYPENIYWWYYKLPVNVME